MRHFNVIFVFVLLALYNCKEDNKLLEENAFNDILPILIFKTCSQSQFSLGKIIDYSKLDNITKDRKLIDTDDFFYAINDTIQPIDSFQKQDIENIYKNFEFNENAYDSVKRIFSDNYIKNYEQSNIIYLSKIKNYEKINKIISFSNILFDKSLKSGVFYMICECPKDNCSRTFCILIKNIGNKWIIDKVAVVGMS